jgi:hypothetical protein
MFLRNVLLTYAQVDKALQPRRPNQHLHSCENLTLHVLRQDGKLDNKSVVVDLSSDLNLIKAVMDLKFILLDLT